jgi:hypothetical protein
VDVDGNGNVNDAGSQWLPRELFRDLRHDITVLIDSVRDDQVHITVLRGERPWLVLAPAAHVHRVPYGSTAIVQDSAPLQTSAGLAWHATTARRRAQVLNPSGTGSAMLRWQRLTRGIAPGVYVDTIRVVSPGASGNLAFVVDSLIVAEPAGDALTVSLSAIARADSIFLGLTGYADSVTIRFTGAGAATAPWSVVKSRGTTIVQTLSSGVGNGVVRWYHYANVHEPGVYVDTIVVSAPGAANSPLLIIDSLHVHAQPGFTVTRFADGRAIVPEGSTLRDSLRITPTGRWETAGTWSASYEGASSHIRLLDQRHFSGSVVLPIERRADSRAPGLYVDTVRLAPTIPTPAMLLVDTMEVQASPLALQLSWNSRRDSVVADVAQNADSVLVIATGPGANTRTWEAFITFASHITLARHDAFMAAGRGTGTGWLRWFRNIAGRGPGLYVDTIRIVFADTALSATLIDSVTVLPALAASLSAPSRSTYLLAGGSSRDSVQLVLLGPGTAEAAWTAQARGPWLTLDASSGVGPAWLGWTRAAGALPVGTYVDTIRVFVQSAAGSPAAVVDSLRIVAPVAVAGDSLRPVVPVGRAYTDSLGASGGSGDYTWAIVAGSLPAGLTLDGGSGVISGQATTPEEQSVTVRATSAGFSATRALAYSALLPPGTVTDSIRPPAVVGQSYADTVRATGGDGNYQWSIASGELPAGLALASTGVISGTPTQAGSTRVVARIVSAALVSAVPLRIDVVGPVVITSSGLRAGRMGAAYADTLRASGGGAALTWSVHDGSLPDGIELDQATGVLSGVPEQAGEFSASIRAAAGALAATASFQLGVTKPVVAESVVLDQLLGGATLSADDARFLDLLGNRNGRVDVGDVRAWLRDTGRLNATATTELQRVIERLDTAAFRKEGER